MELGSAESETLGRGGGGGGGSSFGGGGGGGGGGFLQPTASMSCRQKMPISTIAMFRLLNMELPSLLESLQFECTSIGSFARCVGKNFPLAK